MAVNKGLLVKTNAINSKACQAYEGGVAPDAKEA